MNDLYKKAPTWKGGNRLERLQMCLATLSIHGYIKDGERRKIANRIESELDSINTKTYSEREEIWRLSEDKSEWERLYSEPKDTRRANL